MDKKRPTRKSHKIIMVFTERLIIFELHVDTDEF